MTYSLRRPLIVTAETLTDDTDLRISALLGVPWSWHALENVSLAPRGIDPSQDTLRAGAAMLEQYAPHDRLILLGERVVEAFGRTLAPFETVVVGKRKWLYLPEVWDDAAEASTALHVFLEGPHGAEG